MVNETANCTLEQYSWAIPSDFNTSNPEYQLGLFDGSSLRGTDGNAFYGWLSWSPNFYVKDNTSTSSAASTATATGLITGTGQSSPTAATSSTTSSSTSPSDSHSTSDSTKIGIGVGVGVGAAVVIALLVVWFFLSRRKKNLGNSNIGYEPAQTSELPNTFVSELAAKEPVADPPKSRMIHEVE